MLPTRHLGKPAPETWLGIVGGTWAILLTFVVLYYPQLILDAINKVRVNEIAYNMLARLLLSRAVSFFGVFFAGFEIWSIHRALLFLTISARRKTVLLHNCAFDCGIYACLGRYNLLSRAGILDYPRPIA